MGSQNWLSSASGLGGLSRRLQSIRGRLLAQPPAIRWAVGAAGIALTLLVAYATLPATMESGVSFLHSGRRYSPEDLGKIGRALDRQRIAYHIDEERRVSVPRPKGEQAEEVVAKLDLGRRLPGELRDQAASPSPWELPHDRERREQDNRARTLQIMINDLGGVVDSFVSINRPKARLTLQPSDKPKAFVRLETEGDRQLPFRTVQSITTILTGFEAGLSADDITVVDRRGHKYLVAGNPELNALSSTRAREEELSQQLLEKLDWIRGVRVSVQLPTVETDRAVNTPPAKAGEPDAHADRASGETRPQARVPAVVLNRGLSLDPEPADPKGETSRPTDADAAAPRPSDARHEPGRVWVRVPRSYYYQVSLLPGHKEPPREELKKLAARTEDQIRTGIGLIVPLRGPTAWRTTIDIIQDEVPLAASPAVAVPSTGPRPALIWGIAGALAALIVAVAAGSWAVHARRPASRADSSPRRLRYDAATANTPGPTERVREFVRRNPEAAASVLERWTSQGGASA
jgi:hypothetical protein